MKIIWNPTAAEKAQRGIYIIACPEYCYYIGSTRNSFRRRWHEHRKAIRGHKCNSRIFKDLSERYSVEDFHFGIVAFWEPGDSVSLLELERQFLSAAFPGQCINTVDPVSQVHRLARTVSDETKSKISFALKGRPQHPNQSRKGAVLSPETKAKISLSLKAWHQKQREEHE